MLFRYGSGEQQIENNVKCRQIAENLDCNADAASPYGAHPGLHSKPLVGAALENFPAQKRKKKVLVPRTLKNVKK